MYNYIGPQLRTIGITYILYTDLRLQSAFPKVHFSAGSLFRRFIVPKVHCSEKRFIVPKVYWSEGSFIRNRGLLLRRFIVPKVHCSEIEVHCSEGSFIRNRGLLLRRLIIPKVQYSEISHLSDKKMFIAMTKYEMIIPKVTLQVINQERMFFADFSVNFQPIFMKFCNNHISTES